MHIEKVKSQMQIKIQMQVEKVKSQMQFGNKAQLFFFLNAQKF